MGARVIREVGEFVRRANEAGKRLATLAVDTKIRFRSPTDRADISSQLTEAIAKLVVKYHGESAPGGDRRAGAGHSRPNVIVALLGIQKPWEIAVGQLILLNLESQNRNDHSVITYLGKSVLKNLFGKIGT